MSTEPDSDYLAYVERLIGTLAQHNALGRDIDIAMCVSGLEPNRPENRKVRDFVTKMLKLSGPEFDRGVHLATIKHELGVVPKTTRHYVEAFAASKRITARYNGVLRINEIPYLSRPDGTREYISPDLWDSDEFKTLIRTNFQRSVGFAEIQQELRVRAAELRLSFTAPMINDATELWYAEICRNRLWQIMSTIDLSDLKQVRAAGQDSLLQLAETCFEPREGAAFVVAVLNKFIWQVKRKIMELPIYDHLMPVILGPQGAGKSTLIRKFLGPVEELWVMTDFRQMTDNRNISLWRNFVIFLDEMGWATKANIDTVKNIISAPTLTRRVMQTNVTQEVPQNVTFIGAANAVDLTELIRDSTGIRRFVSLTMRRHPDRSIINAIDWQQVWQSVDHEADDPMAGFQEALSTRQEAERIKSPVEEWLDVVAPSPAHRLDRRFQSVDLHTQFRDFEDLRFPGLIKTSLRGFIREMKHLAAAPDSKFSCIEDRSLILWAWRRTE